MTSVEKFIKVIKLTKAILLKPENVDKLVFLVKTQ